MDPLIQLYSEQGLPLEGQGASKSDVLGKALLHGTSHIWIWQMRAAEIDILLQQRARGKLVWPNRLDISAAGRINLGESPLTAAVREAGEELNLEVSNGDLRFIGVHRGYFIADDRSWTANEIRWLYSLYLPHQKDFVVREEEVSSVQWKPLTEVRSDLQHDERRHLYTQHGNTYFSLVFDNIEAQAHGILAHH